MHCFVSVPLNANELQLAAQRAELHRPVSFYLRHRLALKISKTISLLCLNWSQSMMERLKKK